MYTDKLLDHFQHPRNTAELADPSVAVEVANPACGDILQLAVRIEDGRIAAAGYRVRGCTASIAAGSALTELVTGKDRSGLERLRAADVEAALDGLPEASRHAAVLCADAVQALLRKMTVPR